ncbi:MAG: hypothetical protein AAFX93_03490 [Verrucomicrobiota bacterium]
MIFKTEKAGTQTNGARESKRESALCGIAKAANNAGYILQARRL